MLFSKVSPHTSRTKEEKCIFSNDERGNKTASILSEPGCGKRSHCLFLNILKLKIGLLIILPMNVLGLGGQMAGRREFLGESHSLAVHPGRSELARRASVSSSLQWGRYYT